MSELQVPYSVNNDAKQRTEWLDKRIHLASGEKEYVEFQIKEAVTRALREANDVTTGEKQCNLPVVRQQSELFVSFARFVANYKHSYATAYEDMFKEWCDKRNI